MEFIFEFVLERREQIRAVRSMLHRRPWTRLVYVVVPLMPLAMIGSDLYWGSLQRRHWIPSPIVLSISALAVGVCALLYASPIWSVDGLRKKNRSAGEPYKYKMDAHGVEVVALGAHSTVEWANIAEVVESPEFLLFYVSAAWAVVLPKRVVPVDRGDLFRQELSEWLGERKGRIQKSD